MKINYLHVLQNDMARSLPVIYEIEFVRLLNKITLLTIIIESFTHFDATFL